MTWQLAVPRARVMRLLRVAVRMEAISGPIGWRIGAFCRYRLARTWGIFIHPSAIVGRVHFAHPTSIVIGEGVVLEDGVTIYQNTTFGARSVKEPGYPTVRRGATVYAGASIVGKVTIGRNAVVGAHSVVARDVPAGSTVVGAPARVVTTADHPPERNATGFGQGDAP